MKRKSVIGISLLVTVLMVGSAFSVKDLERRKEGGRAYKHSGGHWMERLDLSQEQREQVKEQRLAFYKAVLDEENQVGELRAKKRTILSGDPVDKNKLYACLTELNQLQVQIQKERISHHQDIRSLLTEEQRIVFDVHNHHGKKHGKPGKGEFHRGKEKGMAGNREGAHLSKKSHQQKGFHHGCLFESDQFSADQKELLKASRLELMKNSLPLKNKLNELRASMKSELSLESVNMKKVEKLIDQQGEIRLALAKQKADHQLAVHSVLTKEQRMLHNNRNRGRHGKPGRW